ncbi:ABC transporter permease [Nocardiopsis sp. HNM0947]|uniref:ABC transporter permease n=1 Tax=Nocardiopsis coralli TaxID=2772213 RepID=A0ABR9PDM0_9ACTN|nr:ABC transporter permease [Nocardiopsis coralli]MBE3001935.1 ABC transporter permease [Nocardiopsis coralli]
MRRLSTLSREDKLLIQGLPAFVVLVLAAWVIWRLTADLGDVEARLLTWSNILELTWQHLQIVLICTVLVLALAVPCGVLLTRSRAAFLSPLVTGIANAGQAAPVIGVIVLLALVLGFGLWTAVLALTLYAFLPVLANTVAGLRGVDRGTVEAARGMGMSPTQVLMRVELPVAMPVIMAGARTALVLLVGAAAFATFIDAGGLGLLVQTGIIMFRYSILVSGAILVALLALLVEWAGRVMELLLRPRGLV